MSPLLCLSSQLFLISLPSFHLLTFTIKSIIIITNAGQCKLRPKSRQRSRLTLSDLPGFAGIEFRLPGLWRLSRGPPLCLRRMRARTSAVMLTNAMARWFLQPGMTLPLSRSGGMVRAAAIREFRVLHQMSSSTGMLQIPAAFLYTNREVRHWERRHRQSH